MKMNKAIHWLRRSTLGLVVLLIIVLTPIIIFVSQYEVKRLYKRLYKIHGEVKTTSKTYYEYSALTREYIKCFKTSKNPKDSIKAEFYYHKTDSVIHVLKHNNDRITRVKKRLGI